MAKQNKSEPPKEEQQESSFWLEFLGKHGFFILLILVVIVAKAFHVENVPLNVLFGCERKNLTTDVLSRVPKGNAK